MREIKFRAWIENSMGKYMDYEPTLCGDGILSSIFINDAIVRTDKKFMQYTGLKDKNGKEIYEGDIVRVHEDEDFIWTEQVLENGGGYWVDENYLGAIHSFCEVIGNIYENPKLLGDSQ